MPIDKIIPRFLVSDEDERLLKEGAMTDALNVTISENGDGTEGVIKNVRGTIACTPDAGSELSDNEALVVIGTVTDDHQGYIYFFVAEDSATNEESAIYRLDTSDNTYEKVFKGRKLSFSASSFVKAEVINIEPPGRSLESILYFTDNINPPRKINVKRAIAGDYDALTQEELDYAINCIKAAPTSPPSFTFETDSNIHTNDLKENLFQFAFQIVYTDGEESAIGPYSKLAVPRPSVYGGVESAGYGIADYVDNVCLINTNISKDLPDLSRLRILGRRGNDGAFFVIDEFDPKEDLTREIGNGVATTVYSSDSQQYRFYNDKLGTPVDTNLVDKLYDNVPQKAESLAIVDNRLMFSNYIEGRKNVDLGSTTLDVEYSNLGSTSDNLIRSSEYTTVVTQAGTINVEFDCEAAANISSGTTIQAGTRVLIEFTFKPTFTATASGGLVSIDAIQESQGQTSSGTLTATSLTFGTLDTDTEKFVLDVRTPVDLSTSGFASYIQGLVESESVKLTYSVTSGSLTGDGVISSTTIDDATIEVTFKFGETTTSSNSTVVFEPRITRMRLTEMTYDNSLIESAPQADIFVPDGDAQSEVTYSSVSATYISDQVALVQEADVRKTFKAGASHNFGVVFYDKYNRSGFVNEIGNVFVDHVATRSDRYGPANVKIRKAWVNPTWAESYQIVYGGSSVQDVTQYTVGNAFPEREGQSHTINTDSKRLYVSLKTLDIYRDDKEVLRDYSFTKGDKLRIINYTHTDGSKLYPTGQDGDVNGEVIEFDIVGLEILGDTDNPIADSSSPTAEFKGTFVVIEAPVIVSTSNETTSSDVNKYPNFDWYHVTGTDYGTVTVTQLNRWVQNVLVELITPRKTTSERVYYEIGERFSVEDSIKDIKIEGGDVYYRPVSCKSVTFDTAWDYDDTTAWKYRVQWLEDHSVSDTFASRHIDYGRSHAKFEGADVNRYLNGITYSDKYVIDSTSLPLSSFNARLANFDSTDLRYGALRYIGNYNNDLVAIQENKLSLIPVNKNIIEYSGGDSNVAVSTNILGRPRYSTGDYGCGTHPSSVLVRDNNVFFADESRRAVVQLTGGQIVPISEANMSSFFDDFFSDNTCTYVSGYDPRDDIYFITRRDGDTATDKTVGYDASRRRWMSRYSFTPDHYACQNNMLYSTKYVYNASAEDELIWRHDDPTPVNDRNKFYGTEYKSEVEVVSKMSPSRVKVFNAMSYEANSKKWLGVTDGLKTDLDQQTDGITTWSEREGSYYASMPRDKSSNSTSQNIYIGDLTLDSGYTYNVTGVRLNRLPIPLNVDLTVGGVTRQVTAYTATTITFNNTITTSLTDVELSLAGEGDQMRGHWLRIKLENTNRASQELYCINTHITDSKSHHPLGG